MYFMLFINLTFFISHKSLISNLYFNFIIYFYLKLFIYLFSDVNNSQNEIPLESS